MQCPRCQHENPAGQKVWMEQADAFTFTLPLGRGL